MMFDVLIAQDFKGVFVKQFCSAPEGSCKNSHIHKLQFDN